MDAEFAKRAEERRRRLEGGFARSFEELDAASLRFWRATPYAAKLQAVHDAMLEA
jgi:hypothetical protein